MSVKDNKNQSADHERFELNYHLLYGNKNKPKYSEDWQPESRDRAIAQNGNDGLHYNKEE